MQHRIFDHELPGNPTENTAADPHNPVEAFHETRQYAAAANHDRDRQADSKHYQGQIAMSGCSHRHNIVETHDQVCNNDDAHLLPERPDFPSRLLLLDTCVLTYQLHGDPH